MIEVPEDFKAIIEPNHFGYQEAFIQHIEFEPTTLHVIIRILESSICEEGVWKISLNNVRRYRFEPDRFIDSIDIQADHPLLYAYNHPQSKLYFREGIENLGAILVDIYKAHLAFSDGWLPVEEHLHEFLFTTSTISHGLFASGPDILMQKYAAILKSHHVECNTAVPELPKFWIAGHGSVKTTKDHIALIMNNNYVIANSLTALRL